MGLRSRQRRLAGEDDRSNTLQEHLDASRRDADDIKLQWKNSVAMGGLVMSVYEGGLYFQTLMIEAHAPVSPQLCLAFKLLAVTSLLSTRQYVLTESSQKFGLSILSTAVYVLLWVATFWVFDLRFTLLQVSPAPVVYFPLAHLAVKLIGDNTKAENVRAEQLKKLQRAK